MLIKPSQHHFCFFMPVSNLYSLSLPHPRTFIKTELNIHRLLAVRLTSCDCVCCELNLIKLLLQTSIAFISPTALCAKTTLGFMLAAAGVAGHSHDVTKGLWFPKSIVTAVLPPGV